MINEDLINYIKQERTKGLSDDTIKQSLKDNGWRDAQVEEAFALVENSQMETPKRRGALKILLWVILVLVISSLFYIFVLPRLLIAFFSTDDFQVFDDDLRLEEVIVPDEQNSYFDLVQLGGTSDNPIDDIVYEPDEVYEYITSGEWNNEKVNEILARNIKTLALFDAAAKKNRFQDPAFAVPEDITVTSLDLQLGSIRGATRIAVLRAISLSRQGKTQEAVEELLKVMEIGRQIQESQSSFVHWLVGVGIQRVAMEKIQSILLLSTLNSNELIDFAERIDAFKVDNNGLERALKVEYQTSANTVNTLLEDVQETLRLIPQSSQFPNFYFKPNKTKNLFASHIRKHINNVEQPCSIIEPIEVEGSYSPSVISPLDMIIIENVMGRIMHLLVALDYHVAAIRRCDNDFLLSSTQLLINMKAYKIEHGTLPSSLDDLVPLYIDSIPVDPYNGELIRYSVNKKIVYAVGVDGIDDGGSQPKEGEDWRDLNDPTFIIPF